MASCPTKTLDKIGVASSLLARGIKVEDVHLCTRTWYLVHAHFKGLTTHPYSLLILTVRLRDMGVNVHRPYKVIWMRQDAKDRMVISAKYVIGADGARSIVRLAASISSTDPEGELKEHRLTQMILVDVPFTREPDMKGLWFVLLNWTERFDEELAAPGEPIRGSLYRIVCGIPALNTYGPRFLSSDSKANRKAIEIDQVLWSTRFRTHSAVADRGVILLIGDAAHIHPPVGEQGMNYGLRDAVLLGEALSKHLNPSTSSSDNQVEIDAVLREYAKTRRERALGIIRFTRKYFVSMPYSSRWWMPSRPFLFWQSKVAWGVSGLGRI
ncbi:hypothetical protein V8E55_010041 [Tylopilus felleus]